MSVINTNITALISQQNLNRSQSALQTSMERLSSGLRINSAKDDAAGQAIANRMTSQISGLNQAQRNANDGISMSQTAEGALNQVNDNLQRIRELTVQASNGTNNQSDLESIQNEIGQRLQEINRISEETGFNGLKVLSADQSLKIQVGANDGETISISLSQINVETLGLSGFNVDGSGETPNAAATADDLVLGGFTAGSTNANGSTEYSKTDTTSNTAATASDVFAGLGNGDTVTYNGTNTGLGVAATGNTYTYDATSDSFTFNAAGAATADVMSALTPATGGTTAATITIGGGSQDVLIDSDGNITAADDGATLYLDGTGNLTKNDVGADPVATLALVAAAVAGEAGDSISVGTTTYTSDGTDFGVTGATISASALTSLTQAAGATTSTGYTIAAGGAVSDGGGAVYVDGSGELTNANETSVTTNYYAHADGSVTDDTGAQVYMDGDGDFSFDAETPGARTDNALSVLDDALSMVDTLRSDLGAIQNRFESAITNLATTATNLTSARSRIEDADYAKEVSNMTRAQILQQAGTSVLAQANQIPQNVLSLLR
ncbi:MAG: flagellin [Pseudomonas sp.]